MARRQGRRHVARCVSLLLLGISEILPASSAAGDAKRLGLGGD